TTSSTPASVSRCTRARTAASDMPSSRAMDVKGLRPSRWRISMIRRLTGSSFTAGALMRDTLPRPRFRCELRSEHGEIKRYTLDRGMTQVTAGHATTAFSTDGDVDVEFRAITK